jgi:hypothetical protein
MKVLRPIYKMEIMTQNMQENMEWMGLEPTTLTLRFDVQILSKTHSLHIMYSVYKVVHASSNSCILWHIGNMNPYW